MLCTALCRFFRESKGGHIRARPKGFACIRMTICEVSLIASHLIAQLVELGDLLVYGYQSGIYQSKQLLLDISALGIRCTDQQRLRFGEWNTQEADTAEQDEPVDISPTVAAVGIRGTGRSR